MTSPEAVVDSRPRSYGTRITTTRVFVDANTPYDNLGDAVIVRQLLRGMRQRATGVHVDARGMDPALQELTETGAGDGGVWRFLLGSLAGRLRVGSRAPHVIVLKPGHIGGAYRGRALVARLALIVVTAAARVAGARVVRVGFSVGELSPGMRRVERVQARLMTAYEPRDRGSSRYAEGIGIRVTGQSTDLAFSLPVAEPISSDTDLCLSFRSALVGPSGPGTYQDRVLQLADALLERASDAGLGARWVAQVGGDLPVAERALLGHPDVPLVGFDGTSASAGAVVDAYAKSRVVVSNRLHAVLLAMAQGTPALAVTDLAAHGKLTGLLTDVGLGACLIDMDEGPDAVWARLQEMREAPDPFRAAIRRAFDEQAAVLAHTLDRLAR